MSKILAGRNDIRHKNSDGKCLLENWVEERATAPLDPIEAHATSLSKALTFRHGHKGLLTTNFDASSENLTTVRATYQPPKFSGVRLRGKREEMFENMIYAKVGEETHREFNPPSPPPEYITIKQQDYDQPDFVSVLPPATMDHNVNKEQCITFWSTHSDKIQRVSQVKTRDTPFKKNASFSTPISEYLDQTLPYDAEQYPNM